MAEPRFAREPVVVIGLGRFGSALALELTRHGTEVLAIDNQPAAAQHMADDLTQVVTLDSTDRDALVQVGIPDFSRAVVAIGSNIEASILTTGLLADLGIDRIWAKAITAQQGRILQRIGAHHVVFPEHDMGERVAHLVSARLLDYVEIDETFAMATTRPPHDLVGVPLGQSRLPAKYKITVIAVKPEHDTHFIHATADTTVTYGDTIVVTGSPHHIDKFANTA